MTDHRDSIKPYVRQAEQGLDALGEIQETLQDLMVDTARRVVEDNGEGLALQDALDGLTTALSAFTKAKHALIDERASDLRFAAEAEGLVG